MKRIINRNAVIACILSLIMAFLSCYVPEAFAGQSSSNTSKTSYLKQVDVNKDTGNHKKEIIIKYKTVAKRNKAVNSIVADNKLDQMARVDTVKEQKISIYEIGKKDNLNKVIDDLNDDPNIEYAQPNYPLTVAATTTDQKFDYQWSLENRGQQVKGYPGRENVDIDAEEAWNTTMGSKDVVIGVLDTGIDISHKDLKANIYTNKDEIPGNNKDDDGNGYIDDVHGWDFANDSSDVYASAQKDTHGTYVAGVIAASANDGGIVGIAPKVKLMPLKFISGSTGYTSDALEAIEYAKSMGIKIINCSFGGTDKNPALEDAMKNSGILFVCAAGNKGADTAEKPVYPAAFDISNILSAASIDSKGIMPKFSSYGRLKIDKTTIDKAAPDVAAPGTNILSTVPNNKYDYYSGTSISAAMVSGVAALVLSYLPKFTASDIKDRIMNTVVKCTSLTNKVATEGRLNAGAALTLQVPVTDSYEGKGNDDDTPVEEDGEADTWYTLDERARNVERFHYGEGGINPASGNYSVTCTDMTVPAPGFQVEISRTYNSRNQRQTLLGRGWTFGFEGKVTNLDDETVEVSLPDGSSHVFHLESGIYIGEGTRASFVKDKNKVDILTTKDQYKYGFSTDTNKLLYMEDKNGNRISLTYDSKTENLTRITDTVGRVYTLSYNSNNLLKSVTDPAVREVKYEYNDDNLLTKVIDPQGDILEYDYDKDQYLTTQSTVKNNKTCTFQKLVYSHNSDSSLNKVVESTDADGETWYYSYDLKDMKTSITNKKDRKWTYWFDSAMSTIQVQDPEERSTYTEYAFQDEKTYYGDVRSNTDRNGNRTDYKVDEKTGNVLRIMNPDKGGHIYKYDQWNNVIEDSECEFIDCDNWTVKRRTFYKYDSTGSKLMLKVQPINGTDDYNYGDSPDTNQYAVTRYEYYTKDEAKQKFGYAVNGLLKTETDPEGTVISYKYNGFGDTTEVTKVGLDSNNKEITNTYSYNYNNIGQKVNQTTPEGETTNWNYDNNGQVIRETHNDGGVKRTVYDDTGEKVLEVNPQQYNKSNEVNIDNPVKNTYTGTNGTSYEWYDNGNLKSTTTVNKYGDEDKNYTTTYTYDTFGNKKTETKPNGSIYRYEYDSLDRLTKTYFKEGASSSEVLLSETNYGVLSNGNTWTKVTSYADDNTKSSVTTFKDYADREVEVLYDDGTNIQTKYNTDGTVKEKKAANNAITYYSYDGLGNLSTVLTPITDSDGKTMYSWTKYTYNKTGQMTEERRGKKLVTLEETKTGDYQNRDYYAKTSTYNKGLLTSEADTDGRKTDYTYDGDGRTAKKTEWVSSTEKQITETKYNYLDKPVSVTQKVRTGDIAGKDYDNNNSSDIVEKNSYDKNGNLVSDTDAAGNSTSYTYDSQDQQRTTSSQLKDAAGNFVKNVETSRTYTWDGQTASETDARKHTITYNYDKMGNQTQVIDAHNKVTLKVYDRMGRNTAVVSPKNYKAGTALKDLEHTEFVYNSMGRVAQQKEIYKKMTRDGSFHWSGNMVTVTAKSYKYDALGNVTETTDALGNSSITKYNLAGMSEYVIDAETNAVKKFPYSIRYVYNGLGQKVKEIYPDTTYEYSYDGAGNQTSQSIDGVVKSSTVYDGLGRAVKVTDGNNNTTTQSFNTFGKVAKVTTPGDSTIPGNTTIYQYDTRGNLARTKDSMNVVTTYTYDSLGRNLSRKISDTSGEKKIETSTTYDLNGNVLSETDGKGNTTSYTYDELNRKLTSTNALQQATTYTYDADGNQTEETNYLGNTSHKVYDGINRLIEERDADNNIVQQILYNDNDTQSCSFDALGNETQFLYDHNLRQIGSIDGNGHTTSMTYDVRGNMTGKKDGRGNTAAYAYDGGNHLTSITDALGNVTSYTYDKNGNALTQTDGNGNVTSYRYNAANKLAAKIDPSDNGGAGLRESYTYYADGQMASKKDRNGITTCYTYDIFGRLTEENAGGEKQSYTYDENGNMLTMTDASGTTARTFDALNRNTKKTVPGIGTSNYAYDLKTGTAGEYMEQTTDPKGNVTARTYDKEGRLSKVTAGNENTGYEYYRNGRQYRVTYPNKTTETYCYDADNQVTKLINAKSDGSVLSSYDYTYDEAGNQTSKTDAKGKTTYAYDKLNRLSIVTEPYVKDTTATQKKTGYEYDSAGNRTSETVQIGDKYNTTLYSYNALNRLTKSVSSSGGETRYTYDNNGNLINKSSGTSIIATLNDAAQSGTDNSTTGDLPGFDLIIRKDTDNGTGTKNLIKYSYDNFNRLKTMKDEDTTASYTYNAQGYRVEKKINGTATDYLYEGDKVVLETDKNNNQKAVQVYGNNLLSRLVNGNNGEGAEKYYYLYNAHGDVTSLINPAGGVAVSYDYDAFGKIINKTGSANNSTLYASYQHDDESGLYYLNARYYDSVTARFITEDSYTGKRNDPLSLNLYTYCSNNPIKYTDPTGHWTKAVHYTDTQTIAKAKFNAYIKAESEKIIVYKKDKNGDKVIDQKKTDKKRTDWVDKQEAKADKYATALAAGDKYTDSETKVLHDTTSKALKDYDYKYYHSFNVLGDTNRSNTLTSIINFSSQATQYYMTAKGVKPSLSLDLDYASYIFTTSKVSKAETITEVVKDKKGNPVIDKKTNQPVTETKTVTTSASLPLNGYTNVEKALFASGMSLHMEQDQYAHVTENHTGNSDNTYYNYVDGNWKDVRKDEISDEFTIDGIDKTFIGGERYKKTLEATGIWVDDLLANYGDQLFGYKADSKKK